MGKIIPVSKISGYAKKKTIALSDKTLHTKNRAQRFLVNVADVVLVITTIIRSTFSRGFEFGEFAKQCFQIGNKSLPLISVTGVIIGLVLTIQSRPVLVNFGAESMLPGMVAISIIR